LQDRVIVFSSRSIFAEGVVSRLRQHPNSGEIHFIDAKYESYVEKVFKLQPSIVIIDLAEDEGSESCLLCDLLGAFPAIKIVRLKVNDKVVQVIASSSYSFDKVHKLLDLINSDEGKER
jgi:DNA-binding NarL/FixJ family response regulator